eukprot:1420750-Pleurochrysis_carterae.AAC.2
MQFQSRERASLAAVRPGMMLLNPWGRHYLRGPRTSNVERSDMEQKTQFAQHNGADAEDWATRTLGRVATSEWANGKSWADWALLGRNHQLGLHIRNRQHRVCAVATNYEKKRGNAGSASGALWRELPLDILLLEQHLDGLGVSHAREGRVGDEAQRLWQLRVVVLCQEPARGKRTPRGGEVLVAMGVVRI